MLYWQEAPARSTQAPLTSWTKRSWLCSSHRGLVINVSLAVHFPSSLWWWTGGGRGAEEGAGNRSGSSSLFQGRLYSCCILAFSFSFNNHLWFSPLLLVSRHISYIIYSAITECHQPWVECLSSEQHDFLVPTLPTTSAMPAARQESAHFHRIVKLLELYRMTSRSSVYSCDHFIGLDIFDWRIINIWYDFIALGQIWHERRSLEMFGNSVEHVNAVKLQNR